MEYYDEIQYVAEVDKEDNIVGKVEKWEAHRKGILHRAFTVSMRFQNSWIIQHRKHPVFDSVLDLSCSSHPTFKSGEDKLEDIEVAVRSTLQREWDLSSEEVGAGKLQHNGSVYYQAQDPLSEFKEHEICHIYVFNMAFEPKARKDFAYGMSIVPHELVTNERNPLRNSFAPWVKPLLPLL